MRLRVLLGLLYIFISCAVNAQTPTPTPFSYNPVPQLNASFLSNLQSWLWFETETRRLDGWADWVDGGCIHSTAIGKTGTFSPGTCRAYLANQLYSQSLSTIDYDALGAGDNDTVWVALGASSPGANFVQNGSTIVWADFTDASVPDIMGAEDGLGQGFLLVMEVTISGGSITEVKDLRNQDPTVSSYGTVAEIDQPFIRPGKLFLNKGPTFNATPTPGILYYGNGTGGVSAIPYANSSGCSTCGDSATAFFTTGQIEAAHGGTGDDTSGQTGVPYIVAGDWQYEAARAPARGGTGDDTSGTTGVPFITAGNWSYETTLDSARGGTDLDMSAETGYVGWTSGTPTPIAFPTWKDRLSPGDVAVDGTNCTQSANEATLVSGVKGRAFSCADDASSSFSFSTVLPTDYSAGTALTVRVYGVNSSTDASTVVFNVEAACVGPEGTLGTGDFGTPVVMTKSFSTTAGNVDSTSITITPGGTCVGGDSVIFNATMDNGATTTTGTLEADVHFYVIEVSAPTTTKITL